MRALYNPIRMDQPNPFFGLPMYYIFGNEDGR